MKSILITNVYSYKNKGDATIVLSLIQELERVFSPKNIDIQSTDFKNDINKYPNIQTLGPTLMWVVLSSNRKKNIFLKICHILLCLVGISLTLIRYKLTKNTNYIGRNQSLKKYFEMVFNSDLVIACGGGYLRTSSRSPANNLLLLITCMNFFIPKLLGKKVYLYSQSIGPIFGNFQKFLLCYVLNRVDLILVREQISYQLLTKMDIQSEFEQVADSAFIFNKLTQKSSQFQFSSPLSKEMNVGLTVRDWFENQNQQDKYEQTIAKFIDYLYRNHSAKTFYFPQVIASQFGDDDRKSANRLKKYLKNKESLIIENKDLHPKELVNFASQMDYFVGTRMHSNILSLIAQTPVIAIEYEHKTRGIMKDMGLENYVINIEELNFKSLVAKFEEITKDYKSYKEQISKNITIVNKKAELAMDLIKKSYNNENT
ncbi:hypothetical protein HC766_04020 [Candidatus Gracilibacteria bacterium]|nr:hypothetical protein [Candidatus Gracilibacteria bacterium]